MATDQAVETPRDRYESILMDALGDKLKPIDDSKAATLNAYKDGSFGASYLAMMLYLNGQSEQSKSNKHPKGLLYFHNDAIFGTGVFFKEDDPDTPNVVISAPRGKNWQTELESFTAEVEKLIPDATIYVRHLTEDQYKSLEPDFPVSIIKRQLGDDSIGEPSKWRSIGFSPWIAGAPEEDETFKSGQITFSEVLVDDGRGFKLLNKEEDFPGKSQTFRKTARKNYDNFSKFLTNNNLEYTLEEVKTKDDVSNVRRDAHIIVERHFQWLNERGKAIGSEPSDYMNVYNLGHQMTGDADIHIYCGYLSKKGDASSKVPVSFFAFENISEPGNSDIVGGYAAITLRDESLLKDFDVKGSKAAGFHGMPTYALGEAFCELRDKGYSQVDIGGAETSHLEKGKQHIGAKEINPTNWVVRAKAGQWPEMGV